MDRGWPEDGFAVLCAYRTPSMDRPSYDVPLASRCTMGVGGPARYFVEVTDEAGLIEALSWAAQHGHPALLLGGGSNIVVSDSGVDALVVAIRLRGIEIRVGQEDAEVTAAAGEPWDGLVALTIEQGYAGLECLSGIPGLVGATPIQNVGAYGQDVSDTIIRVRAYDRLARRVEVLPADQCGFGYRDSRFKSREPDRFAVLSVTYRLRRGGRPTLRYRELLEHFQAPGAGEPDLAAVRRAVLAIRRAKSMVLDPGDPSSRSCGSFFVNPVVPLDHAERIARMVPEVAMPRYPALDGKVKLSAAWLIEQAGFRRGHRDGKVGLSPRHALALVCHDGARASDVVRLAKAIKGGVREKFMVDLSPEPNLWGFGDDLRSRADGPV